MVERGRLVGRLGRDRLLVLQGFSGGYFVFQRRFLVFGLFFLAVLFFSSVLVFFPRHTEKGLLLGLWLDCSRLDCNPSILFVSSQVCPELICRVPLSWVSCVIGLFVGFRNSFCFTFSFGYFIA